MNLTVLHVACPLAPVSEESVGSAAQVLSHLDRALVKERKRSIVIAAEGSRTRGIHWAVPRLSGPVTAEQRSTTYAHLRAAIRDALGCWQIDLVHMHGLDFAEYLPAPGIPTLVTLHHPTTSYRLDALKPARPLTFLHCITPAQRRACPPGCAFLPDVPLGAESSGRFQRQCGYIYVRGRLAPESGLHLALDAAQRAGVGVLIEGEATPSPAHRRYFDQEIGPRLRPGVHLLGRINATRRRRLLGAARCAVIPSWTGEMGSSLPHESLAAGVPVVACSSAALGDIVDHGRTGFIVQGIAAMSDAIRAASTIAREDCVAAAAARFSLDQMISRYMELYDFVAYAGKTPVPAAAPAGPAWDRVESAREISQEPPHDDDPASDTPCCA